MATAFVAHVEGCGSVASPRELAPRPRKFRRRPAFSAAMARLLALCALGLALAAPPAQAGRWVAGDLHVHTTYSHDVWAGPGDDNTPVEDFYTLGQSVSEDFAIARLRGLDYLAITDHNDVRSQADPGFSTSGVLGIPAYENSLRGHGQMLGARRLYDNGDSGAAAVRALQLALEADGGLLQANHPTDPVWAYPYEQVPVSTVEAWNLPWVYQPPLPSAGDHEAALAFWRALLDRGAHVGLTGGSDSHWKSTLAAQGPGQPTTWVYVDELSVRGVLDALRAGRTSVSAQPPALGGARVFLEGRVGRLWSAMPGDTLAPGAKLRVRVVGAPGATLELASDGRRPSIAVPVTSADFTRRFKAPEGATYAFAKVYGDDRPAERQELCRAVPAIDLDGRTAYCHNRVAMLALSSAIYLAPPRL